MKRIAAVFILMFFVMACDPPENEPVQIVPENMENSSDKDKTDTVKISTTGKENSTDINARTAKTNKPLLIARGSEPGWYAEFFADHLRLLVNNGTDSLSLENDFSNINNDAIYNTTLVQSKNNKNYNLVIFIENRSCTEEGSGEKREKSISVKYNTKVYKGCATAN